MAPSKKSKKVTVKPLDMDSPVAKRKLTINSKASFKRFGSWLLEIVTVFLTSLLYRGLHAILAINAAADGDGITGYQKLCLDRYEKEKTQEKPFEAFAKAHRFQIRQQGKKTPTMLNQDEWEELTSSKLVNSVIIQQPLPRVGVLMRKASQEERAELAVYFAKAEARVKGHAVQTVDDFIQERKALKAAKAAAAAAALKAAQADRMEPEF